ncbi:MAG TPA: hypothetical protein VGP63_17355 [Planctomycetaceae bacterium]|nr:hypothetical protein [Planctomycetaceae bacterium]
MACSWVTLFGNAQVGATVQEAWTLAAELDMADPARLRELFRRMVESINCYFEQENKTAAIAAVFAGESSIDASCHM